MARVKYGAARHKKKKRLLKEDRGRPGAPGRLWRLAKEAAVRSRVFAFRDRRARKREFRRLWVTRLTAACRLRGVNYSRFIFGIQAAGIELNRKVLSEMAISSPDDFEAVVEIAKQHQPGNAAAA